MTSRALLVACSIAPLLAPGLSMAQDFDASARRWGLGVQLGVFDAPRGHVGIPTHADLSAIHLPAALVVRWQMTRRMAITAGLGLPQSGVGVSGWVGHEMFARLVTSPKRVVGLDLYEDAGLQLGFAGPDSFARRDNEFVGYAYVYSGPLAIAARLPLGLRLTWLDGAFDTYLESTPMLILTPPVEALFDLAVGVRFRL